MTTTTSNITTAKSTFLRSQIRLLSSPLHPSPTWQDTLTQPAPDTTTTTPTPLPPQTLDEILTKLAAKIKSHNRLVFSAPTQRHVAEQIDALYWAEIDAHDPPDPESVFVLRDVDLSETKAVAALGVGLDELGQASGLEQQRHDERYREVRGVLGERVARRDGLRARVEGLRGLRGLVGAFDEGVQGNLVTREGELAVELERLKVLVARVVAGIGNGLGAGGVGEQGVREEREVVMSEQQKLQRVMDLD